MKNLYSKEEISMLKNVEISRPNMGRISQIKKFAELQRYKRIGIANCISMQKEAEKLKEFLQDKFEVYTVNCRIDSMDKNQLFEDDSFQGLACNPKGQAEYLNSKNTDLNIVMGLCHGQDIMFNINSKAPTTTLVVKDKKYNHNPLNALQENN